MSDNSEEKIMIERLPTSEPLNLHAGCVMHAEPLGDGGYLFRMWRSGTLYVAYRVPDVHLLAQQIRHIAALIDSNENWMEPRQ